MEPSKIIIMMQIQGQTATPAPLSKRLLAIFYDSFLLIAVLFLAMAVMLLFSGGHQFEAGNPFLTLYLLLVSYVFFGWFWTHGGQTLGMRAWKLRIQQADGETISWRQVTIRFVSGLPAWIVFFIGIALSAGIPLHRYHWLEYLSNLSKELILIVGMVWLVIDQWPNGWRDKLSNTQIIKLNQDAG